MKKHTYSPGVLIAWDIAVIETTRAQQPWIDPEQYMCGLFKIKDALPYIDKSDKFTKKDIDLLRFEISLLDNVLAHSRIDRTRARRRLREIVGRGSRTWDERATVHRSPELRKIFERAGKIAESFKSNTVHAVHLTEALFESPTIAIHKLLGELDVKPLVIEQNAEKANGPVGLQPLSPDRIDKGGTGQDPGSIRDDILTELGRDLTALASDGKLDPVIGRRDEMLQTVRTLTRKTKSNPVLVGDAGVGKTAIVEGLAVRIVEKNISENLWDHRIVELRMSALVAGTKYRGDFEDRINQIINIASQDKKLILFLDELHTLVGAGDSGGLDAANILKPALARGDIRCIGATTFEEYQRYIEDDAALSRRFICIIINEPDENETIEILQGLKPRFEQHHSSKIENEALTTAVKLSQRYIKDRHLPDKAIDLLDEACARVKVDTLSYIGGPDTAPGSVCNKAIEPVTPRIVAEVVAEKTGIEINDLIDSESDKYLQLEQDLLQQIFGQDGAVNTVTARLKLAASGLRNETKPMGVFLFLGPTGVGKTYLAKLLAENLFGGVENLIRIDMSEFMEQHNVARLIGSPPGYVGHDEEGQLTGALKKRPYSLILLDEIEKAHPQVWDIFLQVFDDGRLTDGKGHTVDASHAIFIMTSNIGADIISKAGIGFINDSDQNELNNNKTKYLTAIKKIFRPEFINRIDEIVVFQELDSDCIKTIAIKELNTIKNKLAERSIEFTYEHEVLDYLIQDGFSQEFGARHMHRTIETFISKPLSEFLLGNNTVKGDQITVSLDRNKITISKKQISR